jgi:hypothetical protein
MAVSKRGHIALRESVTSYVPVPKPHRFGGSLPLSAKPQGGVMRFDILHVSNRVLRELFRLETLALPLFDKDGDPA